MRNLTESGMYLAAARRWKLTRVQFAVIGTTLGILGLASIWPALLTLWNLWTTDALKSIGMVVPLVSLVLILRAWRGLGWQAEGTWWGLALLLVTTVVTLVQQQTILLLVVSPAISALGASFQSPPFSQHQPGTFTDPWVSN